ncbi:MAG: hypothetical protein QG597_687 [Actinomycetota bacterium]|nr:hypothetical protein [Actinomycetota bacterium]
MGKAPEIKAAIRASRSKVEWTLDSDTGQIVPQVPEEEVQEELAVRHSRAQASPAPLPQPVQSAEATWD